jgi:hypothetical protein
MSNGYVYPEYHRSTANEMAHIFLTIMAAVLVLFAFGATQRQLLDIDTNRYLDARSSVWPIERGM